MRKIKIIAMSLLSITLLSGGLLTFFVYLVTQESPLIIEASRVSAAELLQSKKEIKKVLAELGSDENLKKIELTHKQMEQIASISSRSLSMLSARYNHSGLSAVAAVSIQLPKRFTGRYINISAEFPDNLDLLQGETRVGKLKVSNETALKVLSVAVSLILDDDFSTLLNDAVTHTQFDAEKIYTNIDLHLGSRQFKSKIRKYFKRYRSVQGKSADLSGSLEYYRFLVEIGSYLRGFNEVSLVDVMQPLFNRARNKSHFSSAEQENKNAIIALALFAGDERLRHFLFRLIGRYPGASPVLPRFVIAGRRDLVLHFIYSAIIKLLSSEGLSVSIGELKEISDMAKGGTGFSFTDLAADRAGTLFAVVATAERSSASNLQQIMAAANAEKTFFPDISLLPENLDRQAFEAEYKGTDSSEFIAVVEEIDRRIRRLPVYQGDEYVQ